MKISVAIMAHPKRTSEAAALMGELLDYPFVDRRLITDTENIEWETGKRALEAGIDQGDWHVVIQDDAILTPEFYNNLVNGLNTLGERSLVSLYTGTARPLAGRVKSAVDRAPDGSWLEFQQLMWGVGIAIPTDHIKPMLEFVEDIELQYDNKIGEFYCRNGVPVYYTVPSLVDHDDNLGSLIPGHGADVNPEPRIAHRVATGLVAWTNQKAPI